MLAQSGIAYKGQLKPGTKRVISNKLVMICRIPAHRHPKPEVSLKHVKVGRLHQFQPLGVRGSQETIWVQSQPLVTSPLWLLVISMTLRVKEKAASVVETLQLLQVCGLNHFFGSLIKSDIVEGCNL